MFVAWAHGEDVWQAPVLQKDYDWRHQHCADHQNAFERFLHLWHILHLVEDTRRQQGHNTNHDACRGDKHRVHLASL